MTNERFLAKYLAQTAQNMLSSIEILPLDDDQVEEISIMFQEELNHLNAND